METRVSIPTTRHFNGYLRYFGGEDQKRGKEKSLDDYLVEYMQLTGKSAFEGDEDFRQAGAFLRKKGRGIPIR